MKLKYFDYYLPKNQEVDFLSVDTEGLDLAVLKSNDWSRYRPKVVLVEILDFDINFAIKDNNIYRFLLNLGYSFYAKTFNSTFFINKEK